MRVALNELQMRLLGKLSLLQEACYYDSADADELCKELSITRQELELLIAPLLVAFWIEKEAETLSGYSLRLTEFGKQEYDSQTGNWENEECREKLLEALAEDYVKNVHALVDGKELESRCGLSLNKVALNLKIMQASGLVELHQYLGGPFVAHVRLTPHGKAVFDNPESRIIFLSHASVDEEIAALLKREIETALPRAKVFISTDPDEGRFGSDWVHKILDTLGEARLVLVLASSRGLGRVWVWYEAGAGWQRFRKITSLCIGKMRKGAMPPPFAIYTALNIDEDGDCRDFFEALAKQFGRLKTEPDYATLCRKLLRLDGKSEELQRLRDESLRHFDLAGYKRVFGDDAEVYLAFGAMIVHPSLRSVGANFDPRLAQFCLAKPSRPANSFSAQQVASGCEIRAVAYVVSALKGAGVSVNVVTDEVIAAKLNLSFVSFGAMSNLKTLEVFEANSLVDYDPVPPGHFVSKKDRKPLYQIRNGYDYGVIVRMRPAQFPGRVWIGCAGWGEWGTSGTAWFLANKWPAISERVNPEDQFAAVIEVKGGQDESATLLSLLTDK